MIWVTVVLMFILAAINYFSDKYNIYSGKVHHKFKLLSFIAGIALAFLTVDLLPEVYDSNLSSIFVSLSLMAGLIAFFSIEKFIYQHDRYKAKKRKKELEEAHSLILFIDNLLLGLVFTSILPSDIFHALIMFLPISAFNVIQGIALHGPAIQKNPKKAMAEVKGIFLSFAAFYGFLLSLFVKIPEPMILLMISFIAGSFFIIIIRETVPSEKRANTLFLILGALFYILLMIFTWAL